MLTRDQAQKIAEKVLSYSKFPECAVRLTNSEEMYVRFANNAITLSGFAVDNSLAITSTKEGRSGSTRISETDEASLKEAVARSEELALLSPPNDEHMPPLGRQEYPSYDHFDAATAQARSAEMVPQIKAVVEAARAKSFVAAGILERSLSSVAIANKAGNFGYYRGTDARLSTTVRTPDGSSSGWAGQPAVRLADLNGAEIGGRAVEKCARWRQPRRIEPGRYTVVLEPTAVSDLVQLMAFSLAARTAEEGRSILSKKGGGTKLGEKLFPEFISLRTDPADPRVASAPWDESSGFRRGSGGASGLPNRPVAWIDKGVVKNLWYDRYWASKTNQAPTPGPNSLILDGGTDSVADLVKSVPRGLLVTRFWYIRPVQPQTLQFTGLTRDGLFLIEDGQISAPVVNLRFNDGPFHLLQQAQKLGRSVRCRGGEGNGIIAPAVLANDFSFTSVSDAV